MGEGHAFVTRPRGDGAASRPRLHSGRAALRRVHLQPHKPQAKEGLSLINGTQVSTALLADALVQARHLARIADIAGAMTVEATRSSLRPFDPRIQEVRPHPGQAACAANLRCLLDVSEVMASHAECAKVQDAYSLRCMPQVHGTFRGALDHITRIVEIEMNAATDNPLVFAAEGEVISGGNFHGQPIALAADLLAAAATDLSSISERRVENLVNPDLSGLPGFLTPHPGLNSGMMLVQVLAAALVSENKTLSFPASVDSIPTSANREDHVPMSTAAARKCRAVVTNATRSPGRRIAVRRPGVGVPATAARVGAPRPPISTCAKLCVPWAAIARCTAISRRWSDSSAPAACWPRSRRHAARSSSMRGDRLDSSYYQRLNAIPWGEFRTAYGPAVHVPDQLRRLAGSDRRAALAASNEVWAGLCHQHVRIDSAALPALPFILDVLDLADQELTLELLDILLGFTIGTNRQRALLWQRSLGRTEMEPEQGWVTVLRAVLMAELPRFEGLRSSQSDEVAALAQQIVRELVLPRAGETSC